MKKIAGSEETIFVYDAGGKLIGEYSTIVQTGSNAKTVYTTNDHLGSPRINTDGTGQVVSRHDYHPFGEEIARTGYGSDTIRKQFTGYERDKESNLDYAQARMYVDNIGRFTTPDPLLTSGRPSVAQTWNRYTYVLNNPLIYVDPNGLYECVATKDQCSAISAELTRLRELADKMDKKSKDYKKLDRALNTYGCDAAVCGEKGKNGLTVAVGNTGDGSDAWAGTSGAQGEKTSANPTGRIALAVFTSDFFDGKTPSNLATVIAHEGSHLADGEDWVKSGFSDAKNPTFYQAEFLAFTVSGIVEQLQGFPKGAEYAKRNKEGIPVGKRYTAGDSSWKNVDASREVNVRNIIRVTTGQTPRQQGGKTLDKNLTEFDTY